MPPSVICFLLGFSDWKKKGGVTAAGAGNCAEPHRCSHVLSRMRCKSAAGTSAHGVDNECSVRITPPLGAGSFLF